MQLFLRPSSSAPARNRTILNGRGQRRVLVALLAGGLLLGACAGSADEPNEAPAAVGESAGNTSAPSIPGAEQQPAASPDGGDADASTSGGGEAQNDVAVTPSGIPVAVLQSDDDGHVVRAPCGNDVTIPALQPLGSVQVVIDPGHGGPVDTGAVGANGLVESHLNLTVAETFAQQLEERGISAVLTRTGDYAVPIPVRTDFADRTDARVFVSIHHNAPMANPSLEPGTEVFVQSDSADSARLGALVQDEVTAALGQFDINWVSARDAGVLRVEEPDGSESYGIIRRAQTPTVLAELGYLANPAEAALFATEGYPLIAARALADAVEDYLTTDRYAGFTPGLRVFTAGHSHATEDCANPALGG